MLEKKITLTQFLIEERRRFPQASGAFNSILLNIALACKAISRKVAYGALSGIHGAVGNTNVQGESQQKLDVLADDTFLHCLQWSGHARGLLSEERDEPWINETEGEGEYLVAFDPLDGSSNIDVNVSVGSILADRTQPSRRRSRRITRLASDSRKVFHR